MGRMPTLGVTIAGLVFGAPATAQTRVEIYDTATDAELRTVTLEEEAASGVCFTPDLDGILPAGGYGFHAHVNPDYGDEGRAAGGHYDPEHTGVHEGQEGTAHLMSRLHDTLNGASQVPAGNAERSRRPPGSRDRDRGKERPDNGTHPCGLQFITPGLLVDRRSSPRRAQQQREQDHPRRRQPLVRPATPPNNLGWCRIRRVV